VDIGNGLMDECLNVEIGEYSVGIWDKEIWGMD
jgi:hypothetical protein